MATERKGWSGARESLAEDYQEIGELARAVAEDVPARRRRMRARLRPLLAVLAAPFVWLVNRPVPVGRPRPRHLLSLAGVALIATGVGIVAVPLLAVHNRGVADNNALAQWNRGGSQDLVGGLPDTADLAGATTCGADSPAESYALVSFPTLPQYGYSGVAGDGGWDLLLQRSMVHYNGSAGPGELGNDIIGFHREPHFQNIDQLGVGGIVEVKDRSCRVWHYKVTSEQTLAPDKVTQLGPTDDAELTLVTCTPWFQDYDRLVWRAKLVENPTTAPSTPAPTAASVPFAVVTPPPTQAPTPTPKPSPTPTAQPSPTPGTHPTPNQPTPPTTPTAAPIVPVTPPPSPPPYSPPPSPPASPTPSPSPGPTPTPSPSPTPSSTPAPTPSPTPSPTP